MSDRDFSTVQVRGTALQLMRQGDGSTVLFLHGADGAVNLAPARQAFGAAYRTLLPVHPGYGGSALPAWLDHTADLANFYLDVIAQERLGPVHLVGHDLGGWIAAEIAVRNSSVLASLTLVAAQGIHVAGVPTVDVFLRTDEQLANDTYHDPALAARLLAAAAATDETGIREKEVTARLTWSPRGHDPHLAKWLHRVTVPTLVVWGADDRILPPAYGEAWARQVPGARLVTLPDCGHAPHLEQPRAFAAAFDTFVSSARSAA